MDRAWPRSRTLVDLPARVRLRRGALPLALPLVWTLALLPALAGCSDDANPAEGDESGETLGGDTDELPDGIGGPAAGLRIVRVEVNQGVGVEIVRDGALVPVDQRSASLVRERDTLVRVGHVLDDPEAWIARDLVGILHIQPAGGPERRRTQTLFVDGDTDPRRLDSGFYFSLFAEEAQPGTQISIELREADASLDTSSLGPADPSASATELADLALDPGSLALRVVLVPVRYEALEPPREPDIDAADLALFHDALLQQNPVQTVELSVREQPIVRAEALTNLGSLLAPTREAKLSDGAGDNVYYHALVDVGGPSVGQVAGIALLTDASKQASSDRVAATVYYKRVVHPDEDAEDQTPVVYPPTNSARTFVHEIGHNQGLSHVACPNASAAGPDLEYPHDDGKIGVYGFGIRDFHIYTPSASHDYMTYCGNSWVSDWTWNKTLARIRTLSEWDLESSSALASAPVPTLVGIIGADGFEEWSISADVAAEDGEDGGVIELSFADRAALRLPARIAQLSDDSTVMVTARVPEELTRELVGPTTLRWVHGGGIHELALDRRP